MEWDYGKAWDSVDQLGGSIGMDFERSCGLWLSIVRIVVLE